MRLTQSLVDQGDVIIEVYPMINDPDGTSRHIQGREGPDFYDIAVRPTDDSVRPDGTLDPFLELENLTFDAASEAIEHLKALFPGLDDEWT